MTDEEHEIEELAKVNASPSTSGLVEQQRWFMKFKQGLDARREAEVLSQLDAGGASLDAGPSPSSLSDFRDAPPSDD